MSDIIATKNAPAAIGPYNQAVRFTARARSALFPPPENSLKGLTLRFTKHSKILPKSSKPPAALLPTS